MAIKKNKQLGRRQNYVNFEGVRWTAKDLAVYQANMAEYQKNVEKECRADRDKIAELQAEIRRLKAELAKWYEMDKIKE